MSRRIVMLGFSLVMMVVLAGCSVDPRENPVDNVGFWDKYFVYPLSVTLDWFAEQAWGEYGISILIVTIFIRLLVLPLTIKQYRSSKAMQALQPELNKIRDKYKDNPEKQQEETMKLFQAKGVNPLAGCLPIFVQMPILIALYHAIMRNEDIYTHSFLWLQLGEKDPYYILPLLAALTTYLQQKVASNTMPAQMRAMLVIFPVMIFVMAMNFASALPLYWVYSNIFTIVQSYFLYRDRDTSNKNDAQVKTKGKGKAKAKAK